LHDVISTSVAFDPARRYPDAAAFSKALAEALPVLPSQPHPQGPASSEAKARVVYPAQTAMDEAVFSAELLQEIERDLATFIGPMASIALKRAIPQASDLLGLYEVLSRQVADPKDRAHFLATGRQRTAAGLGRPARSRPTPAKAIEPARDDSVEPPNPASIVAIQSDLTRYIGPIARILVNRELQKFESLAKLCLVLAAHIPDERERRAFLNAHGTE
jgi:serine/threonine-protein kinase